MPTPEEKKATEQRFLIAAQQLGTFIPDGILTPREEPDFELLTKDGLIGIEVTELMRAGDDRKSPYPIHIEKFHKEVLRIAESVYYSNLDAIPATVTVYFTEAKGKTDKNELARSLAEVVKKNAHRSMPTVNLSRMQLPDGILAMSIWGEHRTWLGGEHGGITLSQISDRIESVIREKETRLPNYRKNLPNLPIWLLMYSRWEVSRGIEFPSESIDLSLPFTFDRVFWYSQLDNRVIELPRSRS